MKHSELIKQIAKHTGKTPKQRELAMILGKLPGTINGRASRDLQYNNVEVKKIEEYYNVKLSEKNTSEPASRCKITVSQIIEKVGELAQINITQSDLARIWKCGRGNVSYLSRSDRDISLDRVRMVEDYYNIKLTDIPEPSELESVAVIYRPNVALSAGYGLEVYDESAETIMLDKKLFISDRGIMINPAHCEIVTVSGNSMAPEYRNGDRVILDRSYTEFTDGQIFAFRYNGECFIKEICIVGKRIKCIPLNKDYDPFFIEPDEEVTIFGRIIPRIRL